MVLEQTSVTQEPSARHGTSLCRALRRTPLLGLCAALLMGPSWAGAQTNAAPGPAVSSLPPAADPARPPPHLIDAAKRYYDDAIKFFQEGRYDAARVAFEASFGLSREPDLLYNLSTTAEKQGQLADAIRYAERYLEGKPSAEDAAQVRERIARLRAQSGQPSPAPVASPPPAPAAPTPAVSPSPPPQVAVPPRPSLPKAPIVLLGVGGGLLLGGIGAGAGALVTQKDLESRIVTLRELMDLRDRGNALNAAAISLSVVGGAAVVAGGVWLAVAISRRSQPR